MGESDSCSGETVEWVGATVEAGEEFLGGCVVEARTGVSVLAVS